MGLALFYKGERRRDTYLYVEREDDFAHVPPALLDMLGRLQRVLALSSWKAAACLAQADAGQVRQLLWQQGYYPQMPPGDAVGRPPVRPAALSRPAARHRRRANPRRRPR